MRKRHIASAMLFAASLIINLTSGSIVHAASPEDTYSWFSDIGTKGCQPDNRYSLVTVSNGKTYAVSRVVVNDTIGVFSATGVYEKSFETANPNDTIYAISHDTAGNIYVAAGNYHIEKFDANGTYLSSFGSQGTGNGQIGYQVNGITTDATGKVYVTDTDNHRVQVFDANGTYLSQFGTSGSGNGQFTYPKQIAISNSGRVYVSDNTKRIQIFDLSGAYIGQFGSSGTGNGQFTSIEGIAVDENNRVYVTDGELATPNARVQVFDTNGTYLSQFGGVGMSDGQFSYIGGIATDGAGKVYVADGGYRLNVAIPLTYMNSRISVFTTSGTYSNSIRKTNPEANPNALCQPFSSALASNGNLYVSDPYWNNIKVYNASGTLLKTIGSGGSSNGQLQSPTGIAINTTTNQLYVVDTGNNRVQVFDANGTYQRQFGTQGNGNGQFDQPIGIAIDSSGKVYVADTNNKRIQVFDANGTYISQFGTLGTGDGQFQRPQGIAIDPSGNLHVADPSIEQVQVFSSNGTFLRKYDVRGGRTGTKTMNPCGIAIDAKSNVYVGDWNIGPAKLSASGALLSTIGESGSNSGQVSTVMTCNITVAPDGTLYISEPWANRVSVWKPASLAVAGDGATNAPVSPVKQLANTGLSQSLLISIAALICAGSGILVLTKVWRKA